LPIYASAVPTWASAVAKIKRAFLRPADLIKALAGKRRFTCRGCIVAQPLLLPQTFLAASAVCLGNFANFYATEDGPFLWKWQRTLMFRDLAWSEANYRIKALLLRQCSVSRCRSLLSCKFQRFWKNVFCPVR